MLNLFYAWMVLIFLNCFIDRLALFSVNSSSSVIFAKYSFNTSAIFISSFINSPFSRRLMD